MKSAEEYVYKVLKISFIVCDKRPDRMTNDHVGHLVQHIVRWGFCATLAWQFDY